MLCLAEVSISAHQPILPSKLLPSRHDVNRLFHFAAPFKAYVCVLSSFGSGHGELSEQVVF
jgi:hypothetical protein